MVEQHTSLWQATTRAPPERRLGGGLEVDVVVVGAGITGLTAAFLLGRLGHRVAVLERRRLDGSATVLSTGFLTALVDTGYRRIERSFGREGARLCAESTTAAVARAEILAHELQIDCALARVPAYHFAEASADAPEVELELEAARRAGLMVSLARDVPLPFKTARALQIERQARFDPAAYVAGLARAVETNGTPIFTGTAVVKLSDGEPCTIETAQGDVKARDVVLATHSPAGINLLQTLLEPRRSYALALRLNAPPLDGIFWDTGDPYYYVRSQPAANGGVLIVGGQDHKTGQGDAEQALRDLETYTRQRFPVAAVDHRWSSQYYESADGLPFIGRSPGAGHVYVATGYGGDGLTFGTLAGELIADLVSGRGSRFAQLYNPTRVKLAAAKRFLTMNLEVAKDLVLDRLTGDEEAEMEAIRPGDGRVLRMGLHPVAVHRDESGALHAIAAVCSHMKCVVRWNAAEQTWDCPCHGSRFDTRGTVLEGPAERPLGGVKTGR